MSGQPCRLPEGGLVDRSRPITFTFNGRSYRGYHGDTLASALLANGVRVVGRSFKYHRRRGVFGVGAEEPNALVQVGSGARSRPNVLATQVEIYQGLTAASQNCWPSVDFDLGAVAGLMAPFLPAGFYYKTFMWPAGLWMTYERFIRRAAGMGKAPTEPDPDRYEKRHAHCDVLVVGAGPAGLAAASAAAAAGARVIIADEGSPFGGSLLGDDSVIDGAPGIEWARTRLAELEAAPEVVLLPRATVFAYYDHNLLAISERLTDHVGRPAPFQPRQRLWLVRARQVVLATGAIERPLVFAGNDRPGVMLASAARAYVKRYAVKPGSRAVIFTNNDSAYGAALDLAAAGVSVEAIVDARQTPGPQASKAADAGIRCDHGHAVVSAVGRRRIAAVHVMALRPDGSITGPARRIPCDLLCVSGGWNPTAHLFSQSGGRIEYDEALAAFVPGQSKQAERSAGAAAGTFSLAGCLSEGAERGAAAAAAAGFDDGTPPSVPACAEDDAAPLRPLWAVPEAPGGRGPRFVDMQDDVTVDDIALAAREGYRSVEHVKRYTTLGMGPDQGKTGNVNGLGILAAIRGIDMAAVGTTTFRPPYTPVTLGAFAGRETGARFAPIRRTPMHRWHEAAGAQWVTAGPWLRPRAYPGPGETLDGAIRREALAVRNSVGLVDVSTLGKIDIQGPDTAELLDRMYTNGWKSLDVGRCRYGLMLREDGMVFDDGTTSRFAEDRYYMTTTTANAVTVLRQLEYALQILWPELDAHVVSVTDQWAAMALSGPNSRMVLAAVADAMNVGDRAMPILACREGRVAGVPARLFRISYSGELACEIHVPADHGLAVWEAVMDAGQPYGIVPYGTEAMTVLRMEKGHVVVGAEIDGRTTAGDLGLGRMLSARKDFLGKRSLTRPGLADRGRKQLVGLRPDDGRTPIPAGAQIVADPGHALPNPMLGHVTSTAFSPNLNRPMALAMIVDGRARHGESLHALSPLAGQSVAVTVTETVIFDAEGERLHG